MKTNIYYFSGTGNSKAAAIQLNDLLNNSTVQQINLNIRDINSERLIFVIPTYAYGLPELVYRFLKNLRIIATDIIFLTTCGSSPGGIFYQVRKILKKKNLKLKYYAQIDTVENYFAIFKRCSAEEEKILLDNQRNTVRQICADINNDIISSNITKKHICGRFISLIFRKFLPLINIFLKVNKKTCTNCRLCMKNCPSGAIYDGKRKLKIKKRRCQNCQSCINICPNKSISFLRNNKSVPCYYHPDVKKMIEY